MDNGIFITYLLTLTGIAAIALLMGIKIGNKMKLKWKKKE